MSKVILVTGASRGIGRDTALLAAERGYAVAVNFVSNRAKGEEVVAEISKSGGTAGPRSRGEPALLVTCSLPAAGSDPADLSVWPAILCAEEGSRVRIRLIVAAVFVACATFGAPHPANAKPGAIAEDFVHKERTPAVAN